MQILRKCGRIAMNAHDEDSVDRTAEKDAMREFESVFVYKHSLIKKHAWRYGISV